MSDEHRHLELRFLLGVVILLLIGLIGRQSFVALATGAAAVQPVSPSLIEGAPCPIFVIRNQGTYQPYCPPRLPALVMFVAQSCSSCSDDLTDFTDQLPVPLIVISTGEIEPGTIPDWAEVVVDTGGEGCRLLGVIAYPTYVAVGSDGTVEVLQRGSLRASGEGAKTPLQQWLWSSGK